MNKALMSARRAFKGQQVKMDASSGGDFDDSPLPEAIYTNEITEAKIPDEPDKNAGKLVWWMKIATGEYKGRVVFPYKPDLTDVNGVMSFARLVQTILGDRVELPGYEKDGEFNLNIDAFLEDAEEYAHRLIGELVEARCVNQKPRPNGSHLRKDGTPWQNWYVNRGLGEDAEGVMEEEEEEKPRTTKRKATSSMSVGKKKVAKKKVAKKKPTRRKK